MPLLFSYDIDRFCHDLAHMLPCILNNIKNVEHSGFFLISNEVIYVMIFIATCLMKMKKNILISKQTNSRSVDELHGHLKLVLLTVQMYIIYVHMVLSTCLQLEMRE